MIEQLLCHLWGDYLLQSDWMSQNKTKAHLPAAVHALTYSLLFLFLGPSVMAFAVILGTHFVIDRWRMARYVVWAKNWLAPKWLEIPETYWVAENGTLTQGGPTLKERNYPWAAAWQTGYCPTGPAFMTVWLLIIGDNVLHLTINYLALRFL